MEKIILLLKLQFGTRFQLLSSNGFNSVEHLLNTNVISMYYLLKFHFLFRITDHDKTLFKPAPYFVHLFNLISTPSYQVFLCLIVAGCFAKPLILPYIDLYLTLCMLSEY